MILISLGGNISFKGVEPAQLHAKAVQRLGELGVRVTHHSRLYQTPAWPDPSDPPFNNAVIAVETDMSPQDLMACLLRVEEEFGRVRSVKNAPRTLDLDILAYHDAVVETEHLHLPHPRLSERPFILKPLCDIAPDWQHPVTGESAREMLSGQNISDIIPTIHPECFLPDGTIMGVVNVTPDSFSDGGQYLDAGVAIAHGRELAHQGADILDIGGESTRPGAAPVSPGEEQARILPVIEGVSDYRISVDTRHADTMRAALAAGADIINDISALTHDPEAMGVVVKAGCPVILMHMQGMPETMQDNPDYADVLGEVTTYLEGRVLACLRAGVMPWNIAIDPGIGFGKTLGHNLALLSHLGDLRTAIGMPLLLGVSRKSFIEKLVPNTPPQARLPGSLAALHHALLQGVEGYRVHDVAETLQAVTVFRAINNTASDAA